MDRPSLLSEVWIAARGHPPRLRRFDQSSSPLQLGAATSRGHIVTWIAVLVEQNAQCDLFWPLDYLSLCELLPAPRRCIAPNRTRATYAPTSLLPFAPVNAPATVRSMALRILLPGGEEWRTGMNNIPVFPLNSARGFYEQLLASSPDPRTGKPDPARMKAFLAAHPETGRALSLIKRRQVTSGFANSTFNSLNAFRFVDAAGASVPVRWSTVPVQPFAADSAEPSAAGDKNYLFDDLIGQIAQHPLQWRLIVTIGQADDPTNDATLPWPAGRQQVDAGTVTIDHASSEDGGRCTAVNYDPLVLPSGIEPSDDSLLSARSAAYARSFTLRAGEEHEKPPSAVTAQEVQAGGKS